MLPGHWPMQGQGQQWSSYRCMGQEKVQRPHHSLAPVIAVLPTNSIIGHICILWCHYPCCCSSLGLWWLCSSEMKHGASWQYWFPKIKASHWPVATCFLLHWNVLRWAVVSVLTGAFRAGAQRRSPAQISKAGSDWEFAGWVDQRDRTDDCVLFGFFFSTERFFF